MPGYRLRMSRLFVAGIGVGVVIGLFASGLRTSSSEPPAAGAYSESSVARQTILDRQENGHFYVNALVNDLPVRFVVDTGASLVALTVSDAERLGIPFSRRDFIVIGRGASGDIRGTEVTLERVSLDGKNVSEVKAMICDGLDISLLGQNFLSRLGTMHVQGDQMILG
jgi:aspartyl protease family protein